MTSVHGTSGPLVLLVEDDAQLRRFLCASIPGAGFRVLDAPTGSDALRLAREHCPDVVLLDLGLPDMDGSVVTRQLREWSSAPIIVISARGQEHLKVELLDLGADDYLTKPFGFEELLARLRAALRRFARGSSGTPQGSYQFGQLIIDLVAHRVLQDGEEVHLTPIEFKLLSTLAQHAGRIVTKRQLLREVWGPSTSGDEGYLRVYMTHLRRKLEKGKRRIIRTEAGIGYGLDWQDVSS